MHDDVRLSAIRHNADRMRQIAFHRMFPITADFFGHRDGMGAYPHDGPLDDGDRVFEGERGGLPMPPDYYDGTEHGR